MSLGALVLGPGSSLVSIAGKVTRGRYLEPSLSVRQIWTPEPLKRSVQGRPCARILTRYTLRKALPCLKSRCSDGFFDGGRRSWCLGTPAGLTIARMPAGKGSRRRAPSEFRGQNGLSSMAVATLSVGAPLSTAERFTILSVPFRSVVWHRVSEWPDFTCAYVSGSGRPMTLCCQGPQ